MLEGYIQHHCWLLQLYLCEFLGFTDVFDDVIVFSFSESYLAVKGAALILSQSECMRTVTPGSSTDGGQLIINE